jgi:hypothetical protein
VAGQYQGYFRTRGVFKFIMATTMNDLPPFTFLSGNDFSGVGFIAHGSIPVLASANNQESMRIMVRIVVIACYSMREDDNCVSGNISPAFPIFNKASCDGSFF